MVTGKVSSSDDASGIPGASVSVKGTSKGTTTDADGNYKISVSGSSVLVFTSVGFNSQEVSVGSKTQINVSLSADNKSLSEVVVVGYATSKRKELTGSIGTVSGATLSKQPVLTATQAMQGKLAGVQITNYGSPGSAPTVRIRGTGSVISGAEPL